MKLYWDNLDNALNEIWRLLGAPLVNVAILIFIFFKPLRDLAEILRHLLFGARESDGNADAVLNGPTPAGPATTETIEPDKVETATNLSNIEEIKIAILDFTKDDFGILLEISTGALIFLLVVMVIFVFLIDIVTKNIGSMIPIQFRIVEDKIVLRRELQSQFKKLVSTIEHTNAGASKASSNYTITRYEAWLIARSDLDSREHLTDYRVRKKTISNRLSVRQLYLDYIKSYALIMLLILLIQIVSKILGLSFDFDFTVTGFIVVALVLLTFGIIFYFDFFTSAISLILNDIQTYNSLNTKIGVAADERNFKDLRFANVRNCVSLKPRPGDNYISYLRELLTRKIEP